MELPPRTVQLVHAARNGDRTALDDLFARYSVRLLSCVRVKLGASLRRHLESGDILQQAMLKAFARFDQFDARDEGSFLAWLTTIVTTTIADAADRHGAKKRRPEGGLVAIDADADGTGDLAPAIPAADPSPAQAMLASEERRLVDECVASLPGHYRDVLFLRHYCGFDWEQVRERLQKATTSAVRQQHRLARVMLGALLVRRGYRRDTGPIPAASA